MPPRPASTDVLRAVATDGHRLARVELPLPEGAAEIPGVIVPRKTVGELRKLLDESDGAVDIELSDTKIRFAFGNVTLTSQADRRHLPGLRAGDPDRQRQDPEVPCKEFADAVDRVSTISTEKSRAVKLAVAKGMVTLSATSPEAGSATEELEVDYKAAAARDRLQLALPARHHRADRRRGGALPDGGRGLAHPRARRRRRAARSTCSCRCGCDGAADQRPRLSSRRRIRRSAGAFWPCASCG